MYAQAETADLHTEPEERLAPPPVTGWKAHWPPPRRTAIAPRYPPNVGCPPGSCDSPSTAATAARTPQTSSGSCCCTPPVPRPPRWPVSTIRAPPRNVVRSCAPCPISASIPPRGSRSSRTRCVPTTRGSSPPRWARTQPSTSIRTPGATPSSSACSTAYRWTRSPSSPSVPGGRGTRPYARRLRRGTRRGGP